MYVGVHDAGYTVGEELPVATGLFAVPALCALAVWTTSR